jgi:hypothetical protein
VVTRRDGTKYPRRRRARTSNDVAEAFLARLDGSAFDSPVKITGEIVTGIERWARLVTEPHERLIVQLDPPDDGGAWRVAVNVPRSRGGPISVEQAIAASTSERAHLGDGRLERMMPVLLRPGDRGRQ